MELPDFQNAKKWWKAFKSWPLFYRVLIAIVCLAIICIPILNTFLPILFNKEDVNEQEKPMFSIPYPIVRTGSSILIVAENNAANRNQILKVEYDGIVFPIGAVPLPKSFPQKWYLTLHDKELPEEMLKEGTHKIRLSFLGVDFSYSTTIVISKKNPTPYLNLAVLDVSNLENVGPKTIEVHTARDLIKAIKPNTIIVSVHRVSSN